jgi:hypothetical protein
MKPKVPPPVCGLHAPAPRLTRTALLLIATALTTAYLAIIAGIGLAALLF